MGRKNYLIEGVSGTGKTSAATELQHRGYHVIHGDRELAYQGDPETGRPVSGSPTPHAHHIWDVEKVRALVADRSTPVTFFCGGSRNFHKFLDLFDGVFILGLDWETLKRRLEARPADEFGGKEAEREFIRRLHTTKADLPKNGIAIDATVSVGEVVDEILRLTKDIAP